MHSMLKMYLQRDCIYLLFYLLLGTRIWWQVMLDHGDRDSILGTTEQIDKRTLVPCIS